MCLTLCKVGSTIKYTIINAIVEGHVVGNSHLFICILTKVLQKTYYLWFPFLQMRKIKLQSRDSDYGCVASNSRAEMQIPVFLAPRSVYSHHPPSLPITSF